MTQKEAAAARERNAVMEERRRLDSALSMLERAAKIIEQVEGFKSPQTQASLLDLLQDGREWLDEWRKT